MNQVGNLIRAVALLVVATSTPIPALAWEDLPGPKLREMLTGRTIFYEDGAYRKFGEKTYRAWKGTEMDGRGKWRIRNNRLCTTWRGRDVRSGKNISRVSWWCETVQWDRKTKRLRFITDNNQIWVAKFVRTKN